MSSLWFKVSEKKVLSVKNWHQTSSVFYEFHSNSIWNNRLYSRV